MKARGGGGGVAGVVWPVYEDFKPTSEWQDDAQSHNLIIYLPGMYVRFILYTDIIIYVN